MTTSPSWCCASPAKGFPSPFRGGAEGIRTPDLSCDEMFYVLEGEFLFLVGERRVGAPPGTFVFIPRGTVHAAKVVGNEPGKVLGAYIPGGLERSFEEFARLRTEQGEDANRGTRCQCSRASRALRSRASRVVD